MTIGELIAPAALAPVLSPESTTSVKIHSTRDWSLAIFLFYVLGDDAMLPPVKVGPRSIGFRFKDEHPTYTCQYLMDEYYSREGAQIGSARDLLEASLRLRDVIKHESAHGGLKR